MKARIAVLADYANVTADRKLNVMGVFNVINAPRVPAIHRQMQLVVSCVPDPWDATVDAPIEIQLVDADGHALWSFKGQMNLGGATPGEQATANFILSLNDLRFDKFGFYDFKILVNDEPFESIPLLVHQLEATV